MVGGTWWDCSALDHSPNVGTTVGLWRWQGRIQQADGGLTWGLVQKRLALATRSPRWPGEPSPHDFGYWRREADALTSDLFDDMGSELRAPGIHAVVDVPGGVDVWMEDLGQPLSVTRSVDDIARAARRLGEWQGRQAATAAPLPTQDFLCIDFIGEYLSHRSGGPRVAAAWWDLTLVRRHFDPLLEGMCQRIDDARGMLTRALATLPRCVNHNDVWPANLFAVDDATVLIDWSYVGVGALGEDAGNLIPDSFFDIIIDPADSDRLRRSVTSAYIEGVTASGWTGDPRHIEFAINALAGIKYTWLLAHSLQRIAGNAIETTARRLRVDVDTLVRASSAGLELAARMGEDAIAACHDLELGD